MSDDTTPATETDEDTEGHMKVAPAPSSTDDDVEGHMKVGRTAADTDDDEQPGYSGALGPDTDLPSMKA